MKISYTGVENIYPIAQNKLKLPVVKAQFHNWLLRQNNEFTLIIKMV
jgi:hypothetical protein